LPPSGSFDDSELSGISLEQSIEGLNFSVQTFEDETLMIGETQLKKELSNQNSLNTFGYTSSDAPLLNSKSNNNLNFGAAFGEKDFFSYPPQKEQNTTEVDDNFDFEAFESAFGADSFASLENSSPSVSSFNESKTQARNIEFFDEFDDFDDLGNLSHIDITGDNSFSNTKLRSGPFDTSSIPTRSKSLENPKSINLESDRDDELFSITASQESVPVFTQSDVSKIEPTVNVEQGFFAPIENASLENKQWFIAGAVGAISALVVATISFTAANLSEPGQRASIRNTGWAMALAAGVAGFGTAGIMGNLTLRQIRRTTRDLQSQFDSVRQGNLNVQATVYSEDELGQLAAGFNEMARVILTTTSEAKRKADEQEEAKESLQRQVIRLLDDVEGAARGDLTVQAEVSADVLGAVADAFNLTIQNLRDIVQQVKAAAREVTKGATNSETFARALSSDALRQAEELAVTLNSVQVMTDSIQRVAEAAREAEAVARDASSIALKGGEAVENTVAGILEIRETVAETTRKVKRLAESSQEISKIVALISQIASRTNLLALNASIEAARAGEAGRGFAIVADEVRQLADKSAKSLKEIEQIVMQIQSETGSVMTAMEEGTQQVIKGTKLAEEAKRSLENIIQVANRIDILVRSITADTVEQTETSRAVAQVMQSVELTAQETSQEAQRVSGALQYLVSVSRDLIASVERFRVEITESR
jgi:twitching motility protein PilJ